MNKLGALILCALPTLGMADTAHHTLTPKIFYKCHKEGDCSFSDIGMGFEYQVKNPKGFNFKIFRYTNLNSFSGVETEIAWKFGGPKTLEFFPYVESTHLTFKIEDASKKEIYCNKSSTGFGVGMKFNSEGMVQPYFQLGALKDLSNSLTQIEDEYFQGHTYSNPWGAKAKLGMELLLENKNSFAVEGYYGRSIDTCYEKYGADISFKWRF